MEIGEVCRLGMAPAKAILQAVNQENFAVSYLFAVVEGKQIRVAYLGDNSWVGSEDASWFQYGKLERVRVVAFFEGELSIEEAESC